MRLGGVEVPHDLGPIAHSDGDVVLHAVIDAVSGAAGLPDIGEQFPDNDPQWKNADSTVLLERTMRRVTDSGAAVACIDVIIHAERPKLSSFKPTIRKRLAGLLHLNEAAVSVKAKTNEGMDAVGRGEAIACTAIAGLTRTEAS